jgi:uncharacterized membrane protein
MAETVAQPGLWDKVKAFMGGTVINTITEIHMLMPDSILFGSILLYVLTQNLPFGVFAIFIFETVLSHKLISWVSSQAVGPSRSADLQCRSGYKTPQIRPDRVFSHNQYPSYGLFSISAIGTYLALATSYFSATLGAMDNSMQQNNQSATDVWSSRKTVAYVLIGLTILAFTAVRLWKCDTISEVSVAIIFAVIVGSIFFYINKAVFGEESINFLGLPYLVSKDSEASPIYVCAADTQDPTTA